MPVLYKITEEEVLGSAGLDAYVVGSVIGRGFVERVLTVDSSYNSSRCRYNFLGPCSLSHV